MLFSFVLLRSQVGLAEQNFAIDLALGDPAISFEVIALANLAGCDWLASCLVWCDVWHVRLGLSGHEWLLLSDRIRGLSLVRIVDIGSLHGLFLLRASPAAEPSGATEQNKTHKGTNDDQCHVERRRA